MKALRIIAALSGIAVIALWFGFLDIKAVNVWLMLAKHSLPHLATMALIACSIVAPVLVLMSFIFDDKFIAFGIVVGVSILLGLAAVRLSFMPSDGFPLAVALVAFIMSGGVWAICFAAAPKFFSPIE